MVFSWLCDWRIIEAEISRLRMVAISLSNFGIWPMFANSSRSSRTWYGSLPPCSSSALSQSKLNSCVYRIDTTKLKVSSVSEIITNIAVRWSPSISSSISSYAIRSRSSLMSNGASLAPQEIRMDFAVLPAASLYFLYCRTAKCSGLAFSKSSNSSSTGFLNSSSSSRASLALINSSSVEKFCSSSGAS